MFREGLLEARYHLLDSFACQLRELEPVFEAMAFELNGGVDVYVHRDGGTLCAVRATGTGGGETESCSTLDETSPGRTSGAVGSGAGD